MRGISPEKSKSIVHKCCIIPNITLRQLAKQEEVSLGAIRNATRKYGEEYSFKDKPKSGRKSGPVDKILARKVYHAYAKKKSASIRDVAKKVGAPRSTVHRFKEG